jgi:hypothetical protein
LQGCSNAGVLRCNDVTGFSTSLTPCSGSGWKLLLPICTWSYQPPICLSLQLSSAHHKAVATAAGRGCSTGQLQSYAGQAGLLPHPEGTTTMRHATFLWTHAGNLTASAQLCVLCPTGSSAALGAELCSPCPIGKTTSGPGQSTCDVTCQLGWSTSQAGAASCDGARTLVA